MHATPISDNFYRQDMWTGSPFQLSSVVPAIASLAQIGVDYCGATKASSPSWQNDPTLSRSHGLYKMVRRLVALRKSCPALRRGQPFVQAVGDTDSGLLKISRVFEGRVEIVL
eukprot:558236-Prymnesium_polylepis.1